MLSQGTCYNLEESLHLGRREAVALGNPRMSAQEGPRGDSPCDPFQGDHVAFAGQVGLLG